MKLAFISVGFAVVFGGSAAFAGMVETVESAKGPVVADAATGMTLYTFRKDKAGASSCYDACAGAWPPFLADEADEDKVEGDLTVIERTDGTYQWAMKGMPLYFWSGDAAKGDATGDGVKGVWDAVRPN
jgi:predicted lipoprotein with Yx(FWY)xxD motif